jgi:hypothetical protein
VRDVLDTEGTEAFRGDALIVEEATVVVEHALGRGNADMAGPVELGADLKTSCCGPNGPPVGLPGMTSFQLREPKAGASAA